MDYGKALRTLRASRGLQQKSFAARLGIDSSYVSLLERGKRKPSMDFMERVSEEFQVPIYLLLLLASDEADLRGIDSATAGEFGKQLLNVVTAARSQRRK